MATDRTFQQAATAFGELFRVDLILSEAQQEHASQGFDLSYLSDQTQSMKLGIPVLTPQPAFDQDMHRLVQPVSAMKVRSSGEERRIENWTNLNAMQSSGYTTTLALLNKQLKDAVYPRNWMRRRQLNSGLSFAPVRMPMS
jgi:hypothetical protein